MKGRTANPGKTPVESAPILFIGPPLQICPPPMQVIIQILISQLMISHSLHHDRVVGMVVADVGPEVVLSRCAVLVVGAGNHAYRFKTQMVFPGRAENIFKAEQYPHRLEISAYKRNDGKISSNASTEIEFIMDESKSVIRILFAPARLPRLHRLAVRSAIASNSP
ncbi:MAG: hypothetical protein R3F46_09150 [bacterium]